ncbi:MAG: type II toxin-antitoxin system RelE/ParE family toxin [Bacteroidaceae bacterium]|nr:type II toxin-antitoxin system RelE/ParE family toxin [Candidatus Minthousia equi]MCQ2245637.1 type II toxin-antitoxin system RelE/ParE family toxin [Bacteroidaceae bacterium]MDO4957056.1 type II toxin-antitoxin system RelE/ParE family toxin [Bacteroidales bacterium]
MVVTFEEEYLRNLYTTGKTDKKHRFQPEVVRGFQKCVDRMIDSSCVEDLARFKSLNYEELQGDHKGISSIRVNLKYRIEFTVTQIESEPVITVCNIVNLSNHYQ